MFLASDESSGSYKDVHFDKSFLLIKKAPIVVMILISLVIVRTLYYPIFLFFFFGMGNPGTSKAYFTLY